VTTWGHRPHNVLAVGAIAPIASMQSVPMAHGNCCSIMFNEFYVLPFGVINDDDDDESAVTV